MFKATSVPIATHLLVHIQLAEDLGGVQQVLVIIDPDVRLVYSSKTTSRSRYALLRIECHQRQVEKDGKPVSIDDKEEGQESVNGGFGDNVGVEAVAEVNGVDVVAGIS